MDVLVRVVMLYMAQHQIILGSWSSWSSMKVTDDWLKDCLADVPGFLLDSCTVGSSFACMYSMFAFVFVLVFVFVCDFEVSQSQISSLLVLFTL